jgi:acyl-CoA synthetase (NDP forming)
MADVQRIRAWRDRPLVEPDSLPVDRAAAEAILCRAGPGYLSEEQGLGVLKAYGLPVPPHKVCHTAAEAMSFAREIGYPVVLRVLRPQIVHKSEMKAVALNLADPESVRGAFDQMLRHVTQSVPDVEIHGVLVRKMIPQGHEVILGAKRDPGFGPTVMFGLGGIYVEYFKDVTFALAPLGRLTAANMIRQIRAYPLLEGARGGPRADVEGIAECLIRIGQLVNDFDRITELDVNPLIAEPAGTNTVADVRIRVRGC